MLLAIPTITYVNSAIALALVGSVSMVITRFAKRCSDCGKWNSLYEANRVFDEYKWRKKIYKTTHRDSKGRITGTTEREGRERYRVDLVTIKCGNCGSGYSKRYEEGKKIGDSGVSVFVFGIISIGLFLIGSALNTDKPNKREERNNNNVNTSVKEIPVKSVKSTVKKDSHLETSGDIEKENLDTEKVQAHDVEKETVALPIVTENASPIETVTEETPEERRIEIAKLLLEQGFSVREAADSTFLSPKQIRKIRRSL